MAEALPEVVLRTAGQSHAGWKAMRIEQSMDAICGAFDLTVSEMWPGQPAPRKVEPGQACEVLVDGEVVITGYVDTVQVEHDARRHEVRIGGRDRAGDLVDCSAVWKTGQWKGRTILQIAQDLCAPFGIVVRADVDVGKPLPSFALVQGETVFDALERAARIRALLLVSDGKGGLVLTRAGYARTSTALVLGENILAARGAVSFRDRFSDYIAKGQAAGNDYFNSRPAAQIVATASDPAVPRYRPLLVLGEQQDAAVGLRQRVQWEANVRAARSVEVDVTVQGWRHAGGLWRPNTLVAVRDKMLGLDHELLVVSVAMELNERGTLATLSLTRADAFALLPVANTTPAGDKPYFTLPKVKP
ncbi:MAG: hypothetical protein KIT35_21780 [Piscinibacter sp.]|uniref:phage baseplate assembly protein n=1 Tax=Piscinibacter sp. TaxID=1903157 RepID=UPI00258A38D9|nr:hypothetical protein [Piscinibacter sp.]MCW5666470.1 hypothetical protein [Piscinibacter sp.]